MAIKGYPLGRGKDVFSSSEAVPQENKVIKKPKSKRRIFAYFKP
jgi:hypothetical protein